MVQTETIFEIGQYDGYTFDRKYIFSPSLCEETDCGWKLLDRSFEILKTEDSFVHFKCVYYYKLMNIKTKEEELFKFIQYENACGDSKAEVIDEACDYITNQLFKNLSYDKCILNQELEVYCSTDL
jgi:hypothetical protein